MTIFERVEWVLRKHGWTQDQWCSAAGLPISTISSYLSRYRKKPTVEWQSGTLLQLAKAAGVSMEWLGWGYGDPIPRAVQRIKDRPDWRQIRARALEVYPQLPPEYVEMAGDFVEEEPDYVFVASLARDLWALHRRRGEV